MLRPWSVVDGNIRGQTFTFRPAISWLFIPPNRKLMAKLSGLTLEVILPWFVTLIYLRLK